MSENIDDDFEVEIEGGPEVEVEDDTPPIDRNREPLPEEIVAELEADELDDYSDKVKTRLKQMKKVWHDERREKERALRENQEVVSVTQRVMEENRRLKQSVSQGQDTIVTSYKQQAEMEVADARRAYKEAYEAGDTDKVLEAQERLQNAGFRLNKLNDYQPALQSGEEPVQNVQEARQAPPTDRKTNAWQERNTWFGTDEEMTAAALGLHQKLEKQNGVQYVGTDEYWRSIDTTMQRRFPEYFGENDRQNGGNAKTAPRSNSRAATVVAPASRSTSSKRVVLKQSQLDVAKKFGLTPEQYAREFIKLEQ